MSIVIESITPCFYCYKCITEKETPNVSSLNFPNNVNIRRHSNPVVTVRIKYLFICLCLQSVNVGYKTKKN